MDLVDHSAPIRDGEELDTACLAAYLKDTVPGLEGDLDLEQFPGGHSNLTYHLRVGDRDLVLRRPPVGSKVKSAHDMQREFTVLSALHPVYPAAPKPLAFCDDADVLGADFYVMERIRGIILRQRKPDGLEVTPDTAKACCEALVDTLAKLHGLDYEAAGLDALYRGEGYVERQVNGWSERYVGSQTDDIEEIETVIEWLKASIPADTEARLVHNDYKFDNVVFAPDDLTNITGVLDWEMTTIGDPLADLGTSLAYWIEPGDGEEMKTVQCFMTGEPGALSRIEVAERYASITGRDLSNVLYYYVLALFKLAVIVQQIYYRYKQGLTKDERFATMIFGVKMLGIKAVAAIESGKM
jgi:aminoglycoside phosphotransferase (APT) family kinase protein